MEQEILFYLLERPRSVSDMIRDLTEKELSEDAEERSEEIPRIAGNWFREGSGYLWRLQEAGLIRDMGRRYAVDRDELAERLLAHLDVDGCFPHIDVHGDTAEVTGAYENLVSVRTWGELKRRVRDEVLEGDTMADIFAFDTWRDILMAPVDDGRRIARAELTVAPLPAIHFMIVSSILKSRKTAVQEKIGMEDGYFHWKNRRDRLEATTDALGDEIARAMFPGARRDAEGRYRDTKVQEISDAFGVIGADLDPGTVDLLADVYLLALDDGPTLFEQYARYDHDTHLLFNLLERGWMMDASRVERDPRTGNILVPLGEARAYLDDLAGFHAGGTLLDS